MGLIRLLLIAAAAWLVWYLWRTARQARVAAKADLPPVEHMTRCARCGLHVPEREALSAGEAHFCSERHRRAYLEGRPPED